MSLKHIRKAVNVRDTRMNTASPYHLVSSGFFPSDFTRLVRNEEVSGSIPLSSTNSFLHSLQCN